MSPFLLSGTHLDLYGPHARCRAGAGILEMKLQGLLQVRQRLVLGAPLARHVHLQALRDETVALAPKACAETFFYGVAPTLAGGDGSQ